MALLQAYAGLITWGYTATVVDADTNIWGIAGETITISITFDDADTWQLASGKLYVASVSSSASLTGGYTISHKTAQRASFYPATRREGVSRKQLATLASLTS